MTSEPTENESAAAAGTDAGPRRRELLAAVGGTVTAAALAGCTSVEGVIGSDGIPETTLQAGLLTFTEGPPSVLGIQAQRGAEQAVQRINDAGGIAGRRPVELTVADEGSEPVATYETLIDNGHDVTFGPVSSGNHQKIAPAVEEQGVINVGTDGGITSLYEQTVPDPIYSFRFQNYDVMEVVAAAREAVHRIGEANIDTIGGISPDYAFGHAEQELFEAAMAGLTDAEVTIREFPALGATDMDTEVDRLAEEAPDVLFTSLWGGDVITFFETAQNTGLFEDTTVIGTIMYSAADELTADLLDGVETICGSRNYYWNQPPMETWPPGEQLFTLAREQEDIDLPTAHYMSGYGAVTQWSTAVEKAIDVLGEYPTQEQISRMLESHGFFTPAGYHVVREDHQTVSPTFIGDLEWGEKWELPVLRNVSEYAPNDVSPPPGMSATDWISGW